MIRMHPKLWVSLILFLLVGVGILTTRPVTADSAAQVVYQTPTALPDGRVVYIVQEGDSCLRIQLLTGVPIEELRTMNRLDQECTLIPGREILLVVITPQPSPTANPDTTPTSLLPTPTPMSGSGQICVMLYDDLNGNATRDANELPLAGGAISISDRLGQVSITGNTTAGIDPVCEEVPEGVYNISMAIPGGYNPTTALNLPQIEVQAGDLAILEFGAQVSSALQQPTSVVEQPEGGAGLMLALVGGLLILLGVGLGIYIIVNRRG